MKAFDSLTESELVALSEDDEQRYIDYACAENGVPLLPSLPPAPEDITFEPDAKLYSVGYHLHFTTIEDASRVLDAIKASRPVETDYLSTPSHITSTAISRRKSEATMAVVDAFSAERAESLKRDLDGAKRAQDVYEKARKEYDSAVADRQAYSDEVRDKVSAAWLTHNRREQLRRDYDRYLSLADGNGDIAARFLANANRDARELLPELFAAQETTAVLG